MQGGVKYHFLSLWYDSTWDWTQVSQAISKHSKHHANVWYCQGITSPKMGCAEYVIKLYLVVSFQFSEEVLLYYHDC